MEYIALDQNNVGPNVVTVLVAILQSSRQFILVNMQPLGEADTSQNLCLFTGKRLNAGSPPSLSITFKESSTFLSGGSSVNDSHNV